MRVPSALGRLLRVTMVGIVAGAIAAFFAPWQFAVLVGWVAAAGTFVAWVWISVRDFTPEQTRAFATREDSGRVTTFVLLLSASVASLVGTGLDLVKARESGSGDKIALTVVAILTVVVSWSVVHTVFALRYAREYYTEPIGGIDFKAEEDPDYQDFAYVAFTVGMTFQVSDTDVQSRTIRRTVLRHALLGFLFGAVILAVAVNVIAGLVK